MYESNSMVGVEPRILASAEMVDDLFKIILGRPIDNDEFKNANHNLHPIAYWVDRLLKSKEFEMKFLRDVGATKTSPDFIRDSCFRVPRLREAKIPNKILVTGSCLTESWVHTLRSLHPNVEIRYIIFNNASDLEDIEKSILNEFKFQVAQIPIRSIVPDSILISKMGNATEEEANSIFSECVERLKLNFDKVMKYNHELGLPVSILNFAVPQINPLGLMFPRYSLSNFVHFVEQLNVELAKMAMNEVNVTVIDFDSICSSLGKRYVLDDLTSFSNHGSFLGGSFTSDDIALSPYGVIADIFSPKVKEVVEAIFNECVQCNEIAGSTDKIKLVIFDLDGTLWRGVPAEMEQLIPAHRLSEGWPLGMVEAAAFLKKRGVLLAIASKNSRENVDLIWNYVYGAKFPMSNFAVVKVSWESKALAVEEILRETNLLPGNCLFVDDNPVERGLIKEAFPKIEVIDGPISTWRRALLWGAELQVPSITAESAKRTESIRAIAKRDEIKARVSKEEYLKSIDVKIDISIVETTHDFAFSRIFELLNKTNQFNSTGVRWSRNELDKFFAEGGVIVAATVSDKYTEYGLTGMFLCNGSCCVQMILSCRIFGLGVEQALFSRFIELSGDASSRTVAFASTEKNGPCATFLRSLGLDSLRSNGGIVEYYALLPSVSPDK
jgi:FkbH-like protein